MIYSILKFFKIHYRQFLIPFICFFLIGYAFLFLYALENTNDYLRSETLKDIQYEISVNGRFCDDMSGALTYDQALVDEYLSVSDFLLANNASFATVYAYFSNNLTIKEYIDSIDDFKYSTVYLYGIDFDFIHKNDIPIIDGKSVVEKGEIIINKNTKILSDNEIHIPGIGDTIEIDFSYNSRSSTGENRIIFDEHLTFKIVGIYDERKVNVLKYNNEDYRLNSRLYINNHDAINILKTYDNLLKSSNITNLSNLSFPNTFFNNAKFSYTDALECEDDLSVIKTFFNQYGDNDSRYEISSSLDYVNSILLPLQTMEESSVVFVLLFVALIFVLMTLYVILTNHRQKKENGIMMVMGMKRNGVLSQILIQNIIVAAIGFIVGAIVFKLSFDLVINSILLNGIKLQNELLRIASGDIFAYMDNEFIVDSSISYVPISYVIEVFSISILIFIVMIVAIYYLIQPKNIKKALIS